MIASPSTNYKITKQTIITLVHYTKIMKLLSPKLDLIQLNILNYVTQN